MTKEQTPPHRREVFTRSGKGATIEAGTPAKAKPAPQRGDKPNGGDPE